MIKGSQVIEGVAVEDDQIERVVARQLVQHDPEDLTVASIDIDKLGGESLDAVAKSGQIVGHEGLLQEEKP